MKISLVGHLIGRPYVEGQVGEQVAILTGDYTVAESDIRGVYTLTGRGRQYVVTENAFKSARAMGRVRVTAARESAPPPKGKLDEDVDRLMAGESFIAVVESNVIQDALKKLNKVEDDLMTTGREQLLDFSYMTDAEFRKFVDLADDPDRALIHEIDHKNKTINVGDLYDV